MWDRTGAPCHVDSDSVICYGRARLLDDLAERAAALNAFNRRDRLDVSGPPGSGSRNAWPSKSRWPR
jgi:hypothetical protein